MLVFVATVPYGCNAPTAMRQPHETMMGRLEPRHSDREELARAFRSQYGRLCMMTARALVAAHSVVHVTEAARGQGAQPSPVYVALRRQRLLTNQALVMCKAVGMDIDDLLEPARDARRVAQQEWNVRIPLFAETSQ